MRRRPAACPYGAAPSSGRRVATPPTISLIDDLKRKDFYVSATLDPESVTAGDFPARLEVLWAHATPFMRFVTKALALPF